MKASFAGVTKVAVLALLCTPALTVRAQDRPDDRQVLDDVKALAARPTPKTADGHPDLNGRWVMPRTARGVRGSYGKVVGNEHQLIFGIPATGDPSVDAAVTEDLNNRKHETAKKREAS